MIKFAILERKFWYFASCQTFFFSVLISQKQFSGRDRYAPGDKLLLSHSKTRHLEQFIFCQWLCIASDELPSIVSIGKWQSCFTRRQPFQTCFGCQSTKQDMSPTENKPWAIIAVASNEPELVTSALTTQ